MDSHPKLLGHQELDRQHLDLERAVTRFAEADSQLAMTVALNDFFEIWREHARFEEELMRQSGFPQLEEHKENHNLITREITQLFKVAITEGFQSRQSISRRLQYWFHDHLRVYDTPFVEHLTNQQPLMPPEARVSHDMPRLSASGR